MQYITLQYSTVQLNSPRSRKDSGEVHDGHQGEVPRPEDTVDRLQLFVEEMGPRL